MNANTAIIMYRSLKALVIHEILKSEDKIKDIYYLLF
jgi:hypothetical protein